MKFLIVGAGAIGGYFGGRLAEIGEDVTFLVREQRKQQLAKQGLSIKSVHGDFTFYPKTLLSGETADSFDAIILATKAYHLQGAIESMKPYVTENTMILPLLNGISHLEELKIAFGEDKVIGGLCSIESTLDTDGNVLQTSQMQDIVFGEFSGEKAERILRLEEAFACTNTNSRLSQHIEQEMWHKYLFISTLSGVTTLFRAPIGPIREQEFGHQTIQSLLQEVSGVMKRVGAPLADKVEEAQLAKIIQLGYNMKSSLQRDMEKGLKTEVDHFFGYLLDVAIKNQNPTPIIQTIYANLQIYEAQMST